LQENTDIYKNINSKRNLSWFLRNGDFIMLYNKLNELSIIEHAKRMEHKSLKQYMQNFQNSSLVLEDSSLYNSGKGSLGQLVEEVVFNYKINSLKDADFSEVKMELKVVPLKRIKAIKSSKLMCKKLGISVKERIILSIIDYMSITEENWEINSLSIKMSKLLLMFYLYEKDVEILDYVFQLVDKWEPSPSDLEIIKRDWELIVKKINSGRAHELSEGDTYYLGAATKGATAKSLRKQPFASELAMQRAFSFKRSYVESIFEELLTKKPAITVIIEKPLETLIQEIMSKYKGLTLLEIKKILNIKKSSAKNWLNIFCKDMLMHELGQDIESYNQIKKAGIELKTICLQVNNIPRESMSFEQIDYEEIITEKWEDSNIRSKFESKKHLWVIFKALVPYKMQKDLALDDIVFEQCIIWNMPISDLEGPYKLLWEDTVLKIKRNEFNKFIKSKENLVGHIRPKATDSRDKIIFKGREVPKKAFWLNARYVAEQIQKYNNGT